jgi:putative thiamine transport system ATP-binding protein
MNKNTLELNNIEIELNNQLLIKFNEEIKAGEVMTVMGPSGSGKSTLLAYIAGFLPEEFKARGQIILNRQDITLFAPENRNIGLLFQDPLLYPHLSVEGNLQFALDKSEKNRKGQINNVLADLGLAGFNKRDPSTLSGGQQARVALARLLLSKPQAVLLDEPFSKLDAGLRSEIRTLVFDNIQAAKLPCMLVTHDKEDANAAQGPCIHFA